MRELVIEGGLARPGSSIYISVMRVRTGTGRTRARREASAFGESRFLLLLSGVSQDK